MKKLITLLLFTVPAFAQFTIPMRTGATAATGGGGGATPIWDTTSASSCNPFNPTPLMVYTCTITTTAGEMALIGYQSGFTTFNSLTVDGAPATKIFDLTLVGNFGLMGAYYAANLAPGSHVIQFTYSVPVTPPAIYTRSVIGANSVTPIDGTPIGTAFNGATSISCGALTTTGPSRLIVSWGAAGGATPLVAGSGFTLLAGTNLVSGNTGGFWEWQTGASAGSYNPNYTNASGHTGCIGFAIKP